jgi:ferredoxin-NADP reductase
MSRTANVVDTYKLTPRVKGFRLRVPDHEFAFDPGQHTTIQFESAGETVVRPYTPTNLPGTDQLTLTIKRYEDGLASSYMHTRTPGDEVTIGDLEGNLSLADPDRDVAFLSTGTGITPMLSMCRHYLRVGDGHAQFVFGEKERASIIHHGTLNELAADNAALDVTVTLSDAEWDWTGRVGYVQQHLADLFTDADFAERDFYVCGVPQMVVDTKERLRDLGTPAARIHSEGWEDGAVSES